jgi:magnesium-protoporphyrin IX monomethyl ester (oxidative) cyclase
MYLNDLQRSEFYATIGLDAKQFDKHVIIKTNQSAGTLFPVIYDVENPQFFELLDVCAEANQTLVNLEKEDGTNFGKFVQKIPSYFKMASALIQLYLLPVVEMKYHWTEENYKVV